MAGIDKTYTDSYQEYKNFKTWAKNKIVSFNYGKKTLNKEVANWVYNWEEGDFNGGELPIMNTPIWLDKYLYENCPNKFVIDRLNEVHDIKHLKKLKLGEIPSHFKQNRKVKIIENKRTKYNIHNKAFRGNPWWLQTESNLWYNKELDAWVEKQIFPSYSNTMHFKTIKSMIRRLRKMYLPKGIEFQLSGRYVGETYTVKIK